MRPITLILLKDLRQRSRDSTLLVFALVLPLGMAFLFNLVMGGATQRLDARYGVVGLPAFTEQVLRPLEGAGHVRLRQVSSAEEGRRLADGGELDAVFVGGPSLIQVIGRVEAPAAVQVARELGQAYATEERGARLALAVAGRGPQAAERLGAMPSPLQIQEDSSLTTRELDSRTYYAAGTAVFFLFFAVLFSVSGIFNERNSGTLARLLAAPIPRPAILAGKLLGGVLVGVAGMAILVVASTLLLGARWGDPVGVAALVLAGVLAATGLMTAVATFARTAEQAANWQSTVATVLGIFGGAFFPLAQLGGLALISQASPHHWFLQGLADLRGGGSVVVPVAVLLGFAAVGVSVALARLGRMFQV